MWRWRIIGDRVNGGHPLISLAYTCFKKDDICQVCVKFTGLGRDAKMCSYAYLLRKWPSLQLSSSLHRSTLLNAADLTWNTCRSRAPLVDSAAHASLRCIFMVGLAPRPCYWIPHGLGNDPGPPSWSVPPAFLEMIPPLRASIVWVIFLVALKLGPKTIALTSVPSLLGGRGCVTSGYFPQGLVLSETCSGE